MRPGFRVGRALALAMVALLAVTTATPAWTQDVQRIAAVVNDEAISVLDLVQRMKFVIFLSGLQNTQETRRRIARQVLRALIDERLRLQEAKGLKISVSKRELEAGVADIERRNRIGGGDLESYLRARGVDIATVIDQIRAQIAWAKVLRRKMGASLNISDDEIDAEIDRLEASKGKIEYQVSEIFLSVDRAEDEERVRRNAEQLVAQIRGGADFAALARQFSAGATGGSGGDVGWVVSERLPPDVAGIVTRMEPGSVTDPIRVNGGYLIAMLRDRRKRLGNDPGEATVTLKQIMLPLKPDATKAEVDAALARGAEIAATIDSCAAMDAAAAKFAPETSGNLGTLRVKDLPTALQSVVATLPVGQVGKPIATNQGVRLLMVCDRVEPTKKKPDRAAIAETLLARRAEHLSRRYMRDLRRDAFIDIRL